MMDWAAIRAGRREALAFLRIGDDFSPSACVLFLNAYRDRLRAQMRAVHDPSDRADCQEAIDAVTAQIKALEGNK